MTTLTTKRSKRNFYFLLGISIMFYFGFGTFILWSYIAKLNIGHISEGKENILPVYSLILYTLAIYTVWYLFKNGPIITIDKHTIRFGSKEIYNVADIKEITLTGKKPLKYFVNFPSEGASIKFNDGTIKYIYDDMYSNSWEIKSFLEQVIINKNERFELNTSRIDLSELRYVQVDYYKGIQLLTLRALLLWVPLGFVTGLLCITQLLLSIKTLFIFGILAAGWIALYSYQMHYFGVSRDYFVVKKHNFFWMKKLYRMDNIKEVVFETQGKLPNCLRIITKDYRNKLFPACTLSDKTWLELKKALEERGITVRNECIR